MQKLIIVGAGGFGREVLWLVREINRQQPRYTVLGFLDDNRVRHGCSVNGVDVLGGVDQAAVRAADSDVQFVIAIGEPDAKRSIVERLRPLGIPYATLIDPHARADWERVQIGEGSVICPGVVLTTDIVLGSHVSLNPSVNVGHDTVIGDYVTVASNAIISGTVNLGEGDYLGCGCIIRDELTVGPWSIVGMGTVVTKPVPGRVVVTGVPARVVRENTTHRVW